MHFVSPSFLGKHLGQADANTWEFGGHLPEQKAAWPGSADLIWCFEAWS